MLCDFSNGMEPVTSLEVIPAKYPLPVRNPMPLPKNPQNEIIHEDSAESSSQSSDIAQYVPPDFDPPIGWRGSQNTIESVLFETIHTGSWHDRAPGETRVHIDYTGFVSFYDSGLTSLVDARKEDRFHHRLLGISQEDTKYMLDEVNEVFSRGWDPEARKRAGNIGSGVDWKSVTTVVVERYGERLESLAYILEDGRFRNITRQATVFRAQLLIMLSPYLVASSMPSPDIDPTSNTSWIAPIVFYCATTQTSHLNTTSMTKQEKRILGAVKEVLGEICRTLGRLWIDAFDVEAAEKDMQVKVLKRSKLEVAALMKWLDWPMWVKCRPSCGPEVCAAYPPYFSAHIQYMFR